jgi:hypothetical protein
MGLSNEAIIALIALCVSLGPIVPVLLRYSRARWGRSLPRQSRGKVFLQPLEFKKFLLTSLSIIFSASLPTTRLWGHRDGKHIASCTRARWLRERAASKCIHAAICAKCEFNLSHDTAVENSLKHELIMVIHQHVIEERQVCYLISR